MPKFSDDPIELEKEPFRFYCSVFSSKGPGIIFGSSLSKIDFLKEMYNQKLAIMFLTEITEEDLAKLNSKIQIVKQ